MIRAAFSLPRAVWLLGLISFVNDTASDMIYPLVPLYLASVLMAGPKALGLIEGTEYDPVRGRQMGNTPQALSHLTLVRAADAIARVVEGHPETLPEVRGE